MADSNSPGRPDRGTPTRILVIIAFIVIALPILLMAGLSAMAAVMGRAGDTLSAGTIGLMMVALLVLIGAAAAFVRAGTKA